MTMLHILDSIVRRRNYWKNIELSELSELYLAQFLKTTALSLIAIFVPVYLYQLGYSVPEIALYYLFYFFCRIPFNLVAAYITAQVGPKHVLAYSNVILLVYLGLLTSLETYSWPLLLISLVQAVFNSLFFIAYHTDFSKIQRPDSAGKELSNMFILLHLAAAAGPLIGGLIASFYDIRLTITLAMVLIVVAIWPLMLSAEPTRLRQKLDFNWFSAKRYRRTLISMAGLDIQRQATLVMWPLFLAAFVFADGGVYAQIGLVTSLSLIASLLITRLYGRIIDTAHTRSLLNATVWLEAAAHGLRGFMTTLPSVIAINLTSDLAGTGTLMAYMKGMYDEATQTGHRISYIALLETGVALARVLFWGVVLFTAMRFGGYVPFFTAFGIASAASLLVTTQNFRALGDGK